MILNILYILMFINGLLFQPFAGDTILPYDYKLSMYKHEFLLRRNNTKHAIETFHQLVSSFTCSQSHMILIPDQSVLAVSNVCFIKNKMYFANYNKLKEYEICKQLLPGLELVRNKSNNYVIFPEYDDLIPEGDTIILNKNHIHIQPHGTFISKVSIPARYMGNANTKIGSIPILNISYHDNMKSYISNDLTDDYLTLSDHIYIDLHEYTTCNLNHWEREISYFANLIDLQLNKTHGFHYNLPGNLNKLHNNCNFLLKSILSININNQSTIFQRNYHENKCYKLGLFRYSKTSMYPDTLKRFQSNVLQTCHKNVNSNYMKPFRLVVIFRLGKSRHWSDVFIYNTLNYIKQFAKSIGLVYTTIDFEKISLCEQIKIVSESSIFIAVHGQVLGHLLFLHQNSTLIEIISPYQTSGSLWEQRKTLDFTYVTIVTDISINNPTECNNIHDYHLNIHCKYHINQNDMKIVFKELTKIHNYVFIHKNITTAISNTTISITSNISQNHNIN